MSEKGQVIQGAPTLSASKPVILGVLFGQVSLDAMVAAGQAKVAGDPAPIMKLAKLLEMPKLDFNIVEP